MNRFLTWLRGCRPMTHRRHMRELGQIICREAQIRETMRRQTQKLQSIIKGEKTNLDLAQGYARQLDRQAVYAQRLASSLVIEYGDRHNGDCATAYVSDINLAMPPTGHGIQFGITRDEANRRTGFTYAGLRFPPVPALPSNQESRTPDPAPQSPRPSSP